MRRPCLDCVFKHLADAAIWEMEYHLGYPGFKLYIIGSLDHASTEVFVAYPELAWVIRQHRINWSHDPEHYAIPYEALGSFIDSCSQLPDGSVLPAIPESCLVGLTSNDAGKLQFDMDTRPA